MQRGQRFAVPVELIARLGRRQGDHAGVQAEVVLFDQLLLPAFGQALQQRGVWTGPDESTQTMPPQGRPINASSRVATQVRAQGRRCQSSPRHILSIRSSSIQPPDTDPAMRPSSRTASQDPRGRGEAPQVLATVARTNRWP